MDAKQISERIKELKAQIAAQEKYNNFFCSKVFDYQNLQSNLSILQQPIIKTIKEENALQANKQTLESTNLTKFFLNEKVIPFIPEYSIENVNATGKLTQTIIPTFSKIDIPTIDKIKSFMEITLKENKIYLYEEDAQKSFLFKSEVIPYSDGIFRIILGNLDGKETPEDIEVYLKLISPIPTNCDYVNKLKNKFRKVNLPKKPKRKIIKTKLPIKTNPPVKYSEAESESEYVSEKDETKLNMPEGLKSGYKKPAIKSAGSIRLENPIALFEKLTLLISAVKSGHNNLSSEIKSACKKLKSQGLLSNIVYKKYKRKYFS